VARTTIYRRYRDREGLVAATLEKLGDEPLPAPGLPLEDKLSGCSSEHARSSSR
jgi:AcrR family transcriptional regulator